MRTASTTLLAFLILSASLLGGCNKDDNNSNSNANPNSNGSASGNATVSLRLTDGPGVYDAVWIDVQKVEIKTDAGTTTLVPNRPGLYNLLTLHNGIDTLLLTAPIPAGTVSQIRLLLGNNNYVVADGVSYPLNTPSAQESGLKLNLQEKLVAGNAYTFWLDFDAGRSINRTGNGKYLLKPVIRAYTAATNGQIEGYVYPANAGVIVSAISGAEVYAAIPTAAGYYRFTGLPSGSYQVNFTPSFGLFSDFTVNNVNVSYGTVTSLGPVTLTP